MGKKRFVRAVRGISFGFVIVAFSAEAGPLSLRDYTAVVLKNNPQTRIASSSVASSEANRESARSKLLPNVNGSAEISRSESPGISSRQGGADINSLSAGINGQALIFDFGKSPYQFRAAAKSFIAAKYDSQSVVASLILSARSAYYNYALAAQLLMVNEDALKQAHIHYNQAKTLFDVGKQAQIEVTKALVDVANADVNMIHVKNALKLAKIQMDIVAGMPLPEPVSLADSLNALEDSIGIDEAKRRAMDLRPEILSAKTRVEAAKLQLNAASAAYLPALNATGSLGWDAQNSAAIHGSDFNSSPNWNIGAALSVPIYSGGAIDASVKLAQAAVKQSEAQLDATEQNTLQTVQAYFIGEKEALQRIDATGILITQSQESLRMSQERYSAGATTSIEVTDAEVTLANARSSHAQAQYDYHVAHANLLLSIGQLH